MAAADAATKPLVVFIVFFGELPPWLPLTLTSMAMNARVQFVVVGDAAPPPLIPQNVRFEQISYPAMQSRLAKLIEADVRYNWTYKGNDIKPAAEIVNEMVRDAVAIVRGNAGLVAKL